MKFRISETYWFNNYCILQQTLTCGSFSMKYDLVIYDIFHIPSIVNCFKLSTVWAAMSIVKDADRQYKLNRKLLLTVFE